MSAEWLAAQGVSSVDMVGVAADYCVRATALAAGLMVHVLADYTAEVLRERVTVIAPVGVQGAAEHGAVGVGAGRVLPICTIRRRPSPSVAGSTCSSIPSNQPV